MHQTQIALFRVVIRGELNTASQLSKNAAKKQAFSSLSNLVSVFLNASEKSTDLSVLFIEAFRMFAPVPGYVVPQHLYILKAFKQRLGISDSTLRAARRSGLKVHYVHKHAYILGSDWIAYVLASSSQSERPITPTAPSFSTEPGTSFDILQAR